MSKILFLIVCSGLFFFRSSNLRASEIYESEIKPNKDEAFERVEYRLWIPDNIEKIRGIIVRQHGCGVDARKGGLNHANDIQWQALATKWNFALLGSRMWPANEGCTTWTFPKNGSARAFMSGLEELAQKSGRQEISEVPWALWGHSGGAIWVTNMTYIYPERVIATFSRSGSLSPNPRHKKWPIGSPLKPSDNPKAFQVPIMFCYGEKELVKGNSFYNLVKGVYEVYSYGRQHNALWSIASHPNSGHENGNSRLIAIEFFDTVIPLRLTKSNNTLKKIKLTSGYLGNPDNFDIVSPINLSEGQETKSWFANKELASSWIEFSKTGNIVDQTSPPEAFNVNLIQKKNKVILSWNAMADIQSSIAYFEILENNKIIGTVGGSGIKRRNPNGYYHSWNYSDQPLEFRPMEFEIKEFSKKSKYSVVVVNKAGLKSDKTKAKNFVSE